MNEAFRTHLRQLLKKVCLLNFILASIKHFGTQISEYSPGTCTSRNSYKVPIVVPRTNRHREGHKEENCSGQERATGFHTCESEVHWLWKTWRDKYKHRVIMVITYWCEFRQHLEKASAVVQPDRNLSLPRKALFSTAFSPGTERTPCPPSVCEKPSWCQWRAWWCIELHHTILGIDWSNMFEVCHIVCPSISCSRLLFLWWQKSNILAKLIQFVFIISCLNLKN